MELEERAKKASQAVFLACDEVVAKYISDIITSLLTDLRNEHKRAEDFAKLLQWKDVGGIAADYRHRAEQAEAQVGELKAKIAKLEEAIKTDNWEVSHD
jgi:hypothetical protein